MTEDEKIDMVKNAFVSFKDKMADVRRKQVTLFDKIDRISSKEKADKIRAKINNG
jgi:hypothetical protein